MNFALKSLFGMCLCFAFMFSSAYGEIVFSMNPSADINIGGATSIDLIATNNGPDADGLVVTSLALIAELGSDPDISLSNPVVFQFTPAPMQFNSGDSWTVATFDFVAQPGASFGDVATFSGDVNFQRDAGAGFEVQSDLSTTLTAVPEPTSMAMFGLVSILGSSRRRR